MSEASVAWIRGVTGSLAGAVVGWGLAFLPDFFRRRRLAKNVRALLKMEISENLKELRGFISAVKSKAILDSKESKSISTFRMAMERIKLPSWSQSHWKNLSIIAAGHCSEAQLSAIEAHYRSLDDIKEMKEMESGLWPNYSRLSDLEMLISELDRAGNPL